MRRIIALAATRHPWIFTAVVVFSVLMPAAEIALPLFAGGALDGRNGAITGLVAAAVARFLFQGGRRFLSGTFSVRAQHMLRMRMFSGVNNSLNSSSGTLATGQVISRSISDLNQINTTLVMLPLMSGSVLELVLILGVIWWMSWPIAIVVSLHIPILLWVAYLSRTALYEPSRWSKQQAAEVASEVEQVVTGAHVVKSFAQEPREQATYTALARTQFSINMLVARLTARFQPALSSIPNIAMVATIAVGGWLVFHGRISAGEFLAVATYVTMLARLSRLAAGMLVSLHTTAPSVDRVFELIDAPPRPVGTEQRSGAYGIRGTVPVAPGTPPIEVDITAGESVMVRGPVASGKTRFAHAISGVDANDAAHLTLPDGTPLLDLRPEDRPVLVFDQPFLFSATIAENIRLGYPATDDEVWRAARLACADEFITEAGGLGTVVGPRGLTLSGGQRQRIALARALLRSPGFIVFDDATSAIDSTTEQRILRNLRAEVGRPTVVYISHRDTPAGWDIDRFIDLPAAPLQEQAEEQEQEAAASFKTAVPTDWIPTAPAYSIDPRVDEFEGRFSLRALLRMAPVLIALVVGTLLLSSAADIALPAFVRHALDAGVSAGNVRVLVTTCLIALGVVLVSWAAMSANAILTTLTGERLLLALRTRMFRHMQSMDLTWFQSRPAGKIMTRLTTDIDTLSSFLQSGLSQTIASVTMLVGITVMLFATDLTLTAIVLAFVPAIVIATWIFRRISSRLYRRARAQVSEVNATFQEALTALPTTQAYNYGPVVERRLRTQSAGYVRLRTLAQSAVSLYFPGVNLLTQLAQATILAVGTSLVARGDTTQGAVIAFSLYLTMFFGPIQQLSQIFDQFQQASVSVERIEEFLSHSPSVVSEPGAVPATTDRVGSQPAISFDGVRFSYGGNSPESAEPAESAATEIPSMSRPTIDLTHTFTGVTAIVGATGAGKSTVVRLVARFMDPQSGRVTADGSTIRRFTVPSWRGRIGTAPQEPHLFAGTVASNIAYGRPDAARDDILAAIDRIGGSAVISTIPGGVDAPVGPGHPALSAGQQHIVALARAELIQPAVMLLDEATAHLSDEEEETVIAALRAAAQGRTALIVAHKLKTAQTADHIVVMEHGQIVETGTHAELVERNGEYARLWKATDNTGSSTIAESDVT
ncbi:ABC transporter ATP-binding protein [Corynebacterium falsenii]|nr:ABC transporter ATP-binding protein [Corynebacterium falsenii]